MREILFRGKSKNTGMWVYGFPRIISKKAYVEYEVDPSTIGQYTGLKDKNGKEIYEGDILEQESFFGYPIRHVVGWSEENALFTAKLMQDDFPTSRIAQYWVSKKAVIGNIHDNPELLKGGEE